MTDTNKSYREQFVNPKEATSYDAQEYSSLSYNSLLWDIEKDQLSGFICGLEEKNLLSYLDFACGTGRVISHLERFFEKSSGIEISPSMIDLANKKASGSTFYCIDITGSKINLSSHYGAYDVITAFRFFLNAEPELRYSIIKILKSFLKNDDSILVLNNHGNLFSHKLLLWPYYKIKNIGTGYKAAGNYMTHNEVLRLLDSADLVVVKKIGAGILSSKMLSFLPYNVVLKIEKLCSATFLNRISVNQMYFVKKKSY